MIICETNMQVLVSMPNHALRTNVLHWFTNVKAVRLRQGYSVHKEERPYLFAIGKLVYLEPVKAGVLEGSYAVEHDLLGRGYAMAWRPLPIGSKIEQVKYAPAGTEQSEYYFKLGRYW